MNWFRQVVHIARKDLWFGRWYFAGIVAAMSVLVILGFHEDYDGLRALILVGVVFLSLAIAVRLVQGDSPIRSNAYWVAQPLSPTAVLVAKVVALTVGITVPAVVGQAVLLSHFDFSGQDILWLVGRGIGGRVVGTIVVVIIAALTPNLSSFIGFTILAFLGLAAYLQLMMTVVTAVSVPWVVEALLNGIVIAIVVWAVIHQYRTRDLQRTYRLIAVAGALIMLQVVLQGSTVPPWVSANPPEAPFTAVEATVTNGYDMSIAQVRIEPGTARPTDRIVLSQPRASVDGSGWEKIDFGTSAETINLPLPPLPAGMRWRASIQEFSRFQPVGGRVGRRLDAASKVTVSGTLETERPRLLAVVPLVVGARITAPGIRIRIDSTGPRQNDPDAVVWIHQVAIHEGEVKRSQLREPLSYVVIDRDGEATMLARGSSKGFGYAVLLGGVTPDRCECSLTLNVMRHSRLEDRAIPDLGGARLAVFQWENLGATPIRLETSNIKFVGQ